VLQRLVGWLGWTVIVVLWLLVVALAFPESTALGVAAAAALGLWLAGEIWLRRAPGRHPTLALVWTGAVRLVWGVVLLVVATLTHGWALAAMVLLGVSQLAFGLILLGGAVRRST
jgi:hypothetical protein